MPWLLATTEPQREGRVSDSLKSLSISHHLFRFREKCVVRGRACERSRSFYPRYIFTHISEPGQWRQILDVPHVSGFVGDSVKTGSNAWLVQDHVVAKLVGEADSEDIMTYSPPPRFSSDQRVRIRADQNLMYGQFGKYQHPTKTGYSSILMALFGRQVSVEIDDRDIEVDDFKSGRLFRKRHRPQRRTYSRSSRGYNAGMASTVSAADVS